MHRYFLSSLQYTQSLKAKDEWNSSFNFDLLNPEVILSTKYKKLDLWLEKSYEYTLFSRLKLLLNRLKVVYYDFIQMFTLYAANKFPLHYNKQHIYHNLMLEKPPVNSWTSITQLQWPQQKLVIIISQNIDIYCLRNIQQTRLLYSTGNNI